MLQLMWLHQIEIKSDTQVTSSSLYHVSVSAVNVNQNSLERERILCEGVKRITMRNVIIWIKQTKQIDFFFFLFFFHPHFMVNKNVALTQPGWWTTSLCAQSGCRGCFPTRPVQLKERERETEGESKKDKKKKKGKGKGHTYWTCKHTLLFSKKE